MISANNISMFINMYVIEERESSRKRVVTSQSCVSISRTESRNQTDRQILSE